MQVYIAQFEVRQTEYLTSMDCYRDVVSLNHVLANNTRTKRNQIKQLLEEGWGIIKIDRHPQLC